MEVHAPQGLSGVSIEPREGPRELEVREGSRGSLDDSVVSTVVGGSGGRIVDDRFVFLVSGIM